MRALVLGLVGIVAACSIPEKRLVLADAPGEPFACLNQPLPTTANVQVTLSGTVAAPVSGSVLANVSVEGFLAGTPTPIFTATTDATGAFSHDQGTGGVPRDAHLRATLNGYLDTYFYPAVPITRDFAAQIQQLTTADVATIGNVGQVAIDTAKVNLIISVIDCNGVPVSGAVVTTVPAGTVRYFAGGSPSPTAVATDSMTGAALVANVPLSNTTISATVDGMTLRSHNFDTVAGAIMQTEIQP
jgi:hypothetical protein